MKTAIKRLYIIIIMTLVVLTGFAQDQPQTGDVIYVYQKDGNILPFLRSEIIEFYYGFEDENGVTQDEPVMQWIVLEDSICKIPLANIDSVSCHCLSARCHTHRAGTDGICLKQRQPDFYC